MRTTSFILLFSIAAVTLPASPAPGPEDAKRAIEKKLQNIWKSMGTPGERTVLFQSVAAGRPTPGSYPFRVSLTIHDYEAGYPKNRYYGQTCVGRIEQESFILTLDEFGSWQAEGRMTPDLSSKACKNNTAAGVSSIPLESLQGTKAAAGGNGSAQPVAAAVVQTSAVAAGGYECWADGSARALLNFTVLSNNQYRDAEGATSAFRLDPSNGRLTFQGGLLGSFLPPGFYYFYYAPKGRPTVSFRNSGGTEVTFCQKR